MKLNQLPETVTLTLTANRVQHAEQEGITAVMYQVQLLHLGAGSHGPIAELAMLTQEFEALAPADLEARLHEQLLQSMAAPYQDYADDGAEPDETIERAYDRPYGMLDGALDGPGPDQQTPEALAGSDGKSDVGQMPDEKPPTKVRIPVVARLIEHVQTPDPLLPDTLAHRMVYEVEFAALASAEGEPLVHDSKLRGQLSINADLWGTLTGYDVGKLASEAISRDMADDLGEAHDARTAAGAKALAGVAATEPAPEGTPLGLTQEGAPTRDGGRDGGAWVASAEKPLVGVKKEEPGDTPPAGDPNASQ